MLRTIYLTRHGETDWNREGRWQGHTDIALNETGRAQALALAGRLGGLQIKHIAASDLARAKETAEIVAQHLGLTAVNVDHRLRERSFGVFEGLTRQDVATRYPNEWTDYQEDKRVTPPGAEPHEMVITRVREAVVHVLRAAPADGAALVVTHGGSLRVLLTDLSGQSIPPVPNTAVYEVLFNDEAFGGMRLIG